MTDAALIFVPLLLGLTLYGSMVLFSWPHARPLFPLWILVLVVWFPPVFFFLFLYVLYLQLFVSAVLDPPAPVVVVVPAHTTSRIRWNGGRV